MGRLRALGWIVLAAAGAFADVPADKKCTEAAGETMSKLRAGDSSATNLRKLSQALECMGRVEDALGATYFATKTDTAGWTDLLIYRAYLFRSLGMEDQAAKVEGELGIGGQAESTGWFVDRRPMMAASIGWVDQIHNPVQASQARQMSLWNAGYESNTGTLLLGPLETVKLEGRQIPVSASLAWTAFSQSWSGMISLGLDASLAEGFADVRSQGATLALEVNRPINQWLSAGFSVTAAKSWYPAEFGPMYTDELANAVITLTLQAPQGTFALGNSLQGSNDGGPWSLVGCHSVSWTRAYWEVVKPSLQGSFVWVNDPVVTDLPSYTAEILTAQGATAGMLVNDVILLDTNGNPVSELQQGSHKAHPKASDSRVADLEYPLAINQDRVQILVVGALRLGAFRGWTVQGSCSWSRSLYQNTQMGPNMALEDIYQDGPYYVVYRAPGSEEYLVAKNYRDAVLVPASWSRKRRDDNWTYSASLAWKASKWLSFQGTWTSSRTESSLEDLVDGSSSTRETISLGSSLSW